MEWKWKYKICFWSYKVYCGVICEFWAFILTFLEVETHTHIHTKCTENKAPTPGIFFSVLLFLLIQLMSLSEKEPLRQRNNRKSHMHKMWIAWGRKMMTEMRTWRMLGCAECFVPFEKPAEGDARSCKYRDTGSWVDSSRVNCECSILLSSTFVYRGKYPNVDGR